MEPELGLGPREFVQPALARGLVELVLEYAGDGAPVGQHGHPQFLRRRRRHHAQGRALRGAPAAAPAPASAQDTNAVVVTRGDAIRYSLHDISDLAGVASHMRFGGSPKCPRPPVLPGRDRGHLRPGLRRLPAARRGRAADASGPGRRKYVDVALLFTTDPRLLTDDLVVLNDDRNLQPADNVTPVVRQEVVERWGDRFVDAVDAVSARLTTAEPQALNGRVAGASRGEVAADWLQGRGVGMTAASRRDHVLPRSAHGKPAVDPAWATGRRRQRYAAAGAPPPCPACSAPAASCG